MTKAFSLLSTLLVLLFSCALLSADKKPLKVFILAGQSNMEGKGKVDPLLNHQIHAPETKEFFAHLHKDGKYVEREDVFINYLNRRGKLTVGYGSPNCIGPELEFGNAVGDHFDEPVLIIKCAWGGKSIGRDFRPPTSGLQSEEKLKEFVENMVKRDYNNQIRNEWNQAKKKNPKVSRKEVEAASSASLDAIRKAKATEYDKQVRESYGHFYRLMMSEVSATLAELDERFPALKGHEPEIVGFVWFQGWNDMYNGFQDEYAVNMENFIRDVRKDLKKPDLPFVIGLMGQNGFKEATGAMATVKAAQASMNEVPDFQGNVKAIPTDVHWDKRAAEAFPTWRQNFEQWQKIGSDFPYHYLGSTITFSKIGRAFGQTMLKLLGEK